jgi:hypothetical protein
MAWDEATQMSRDQLGIDTIGAPDAGSDNHPDGLALIEIGDRISARSRCDGERTDERERKQNGSDHRERLRALVLYGSCVPETDYGD